MIKVLQLIYMNYEEEYKNETHQERKTQEPFIKNKTIYTGVFQNLFKSVLKRI